MDEAQRQQRLAALNTANSNMAMAQNISRGVPPTNAQIATALEGTERALRSNTIPPQAQKVTHDTATLLHDMKEALVDRNKDENIQGLIRDIGMMSTTAGPKVKAAKPALIAGKAAQGSIEDATESLKQLIRAVVRQHDFRVGLREVVSTLQWAFYQRTHQVRSNVDQQWSGDQFYVCHSNPHLATMGTTTTTSTATPSTIPTIVPSGIPTYQAHPSGATTLPRSTVLPATTGAPLTPGYNTVLPAATGAAATTGVVAGAVSSVPPSHDFEPPKAAVTEAQKRLANLRPMTEAERVELRTRLLTSMLKLNATPELRQAMTNFYNVLSWAKGQTMKAQSSISSAITSANAVPTTASRGVATTTTGITPVPGAIASAPTFKSVMKRFKRLLEEFTGNKSLTDLATYTRDFTYLVKDDPKLNALFQDAGSFGTDFVNGNYTSMNQIPPHQISRLDNLIQRTDDSFMGMANHYLLWRLLEEIQDVGNAIRDDPLRQKLAQDTRILMQDFIYYDGMGNPQLNTEVVSQLRYAIIPILREELSYIPLPRIEGSDDKIDYWVEGVVLTTTDILPDNVKIDARSKTLFNRPGLSGGAINTIRVTLDNVRIHLKNVKFWYRKKTFPKMTDQGFVDFFLTRNGLRVSLKLESNFAAENIFTVRDVRVNADRLKVKIHQSHHDFLYAIVLGLFTGRIRRTIELKTEEAIRNSFAKINAATNQMVRSISAARGQTTSGLGSKITQPLASAMNTYVHPSTTH